MSNRLCVKVLIMTIFVAGSLPNITHARFVTDIKDTLHIPFSRNSVEVDGNLDDWETFSEFVFSDTASRLYSPNPWPLELSFPDVHLADVRKPLSRNTTRVKCFWNLKGLYFGFKVSDAHLWAELNNGQDNPDIFLNDGIEIYIDAKGDSKERMDINDYQIIIDVRSACVVFRGNRILRDSSKLAVPKDYGQNVYIEYALVAFGSLNDNIPDTGYVVEIRVPFESLGITPGSGKTLKFDFCNNDNDYPHTDKALLFPSTCLIWTYNSLGYCDYGFPEYWITARLTESFSWREKALDRFSRLWFLLLLGTVLFFAVLIVLMRRKQAGRSSVGETYPVASSFIATETYHLSISSQNKQLLEKLSDFILRRFAENLSSAMLAAHVGLSIRTLQRITKEELNCTPTQYIHQVKLKKAAELLLTTEDTIAEISWALGFTSPAYFSMVFKKQFGLSPGEYRKRGPISEPSAGNQSK